MAGITPEAYVSTWVRLGGDGTIEVTGNHAAAEALYYAEVPAGEIWTITRMLVFAQDTGSFDAASYGNGITLTNGLGFRIDKLQGDGAFTATDLGDGIRLKTNAEWGAFCYDVDVKTWGIGDEILVARWTFSKAGDPEGVRLNAGDRFVVSANDNLSGLNAHRFLVQGQRR